jgi:hypothetical protein
MRNDEEKQWGQVSTLWTIRNQKGISNNEQGMSNV